MTAEGIQELPLEEVLGDRFGRYSKYIIQERALPDVRDGLKPVQRRILYAMHEDSNTHDKAFRKAAKTVGNVIGNYHPHGDTSVYDAMVRMSQTWKMRDPLIEMHGNNGSIDGDPPAAMRYTEARTSHLASQMLADIEKKTVDFVMNFDDTSEEPTVLPSRFPNLLVNGSTGISAGYATDIPPHNLGEVIDAVIMRMKQANCSVDELLTVLQGPDFPTGGIIQGVDQLKKAYETGKGKIVVRGKATVEPIRGGREQIVITEIPFEINKANLVKKMDEFRLDRKVEGISEVRDETDRTGLRIVIELKKEADSEGVLHYLFKNTDLQITYSFNMVAIHHRRPMLMSLPSMLDAYIAHQKDVVTRRTAYDAQRAKERAHIVEGLIKAVSILDEVIATIRASKDKRNAKERLIAAYDFTEIQAEAIVMLQLYRLTNTDITSLENEASELREKIVELESILASEARLVAVIQSELKAVKKQFATPRRTEIEEQVQTLKIAKEVVVASEDVMVTVSKDGYIKRTGLRSYAASGGKELALKETDRLLYQEELNTTDTLLLFTNRGNYLYCPVHTLPDIRWKDLGQHVSHLVPIEKEEMLVGAIPVKDFKQDASLVFFTKHGMVKRTELMNYEAQRYSKPLVAVNVKGDDEVVDVHMAKGNEDVFVVTQNGYGLYFTLEEVNSVGTRAAGVKAINLKDGDLVVTGALLQQETTDFVVVVTQRASSKKMRLTEFEKTSRAKRGVLMLRELKANPHRIVKALFPQLDEKVEVVFGNGNTGTIDPSQLRWNDRYSNGSFFADEHEYGAVAEARLVKKEDPLP
ncbi:DNA topoisomerase IV subunit A [Bacillus fonticola]|uniref:DNA topoisomerase IV subunit A n=1 Tax=Bacillus fonticola TaxID=2728853 RepID=UPI001472A90D|nr:DNA topoisomerase IV subunit A [Bacillus fonticola]